MRRLKLPEALAVHLEVWRLVFDPSAPVPDADWALLAGDETARALRLRRHADKVRLVRSRAALRRLLASRLGSAPQAVRLAAGLHGKPCLTHPGGPVSDFNVSHAGQFAMIVIASRGAVGVDIESCDCSLDVASLEAVVDSPIERQLVSTQRPGFFERWVVKEAVLKALGVGVAQHLQQLTVLPPAHDDDRYRVHWTCRDSMPPAAWRLPAPPGYACALAWSAEPPHTTLPIHT